MYCKACVFKLLKHEEKKKKCDALTKVFTDIINLSASKAFQPKMGKKGRVSGEGKW